jgi:hypothetical protein
MCIHVQYTCMVIPVHDDLHVPDDIVYSVFCISINKSSASETPLTGFVSALHVVRVHAHVISCACVCTCTVESRDYAPPPPPPAFLHASIGRKWGAYTRDCDIAA